ncbi:hypothetical protein JOQ06_021598 [Pogonophryne albipinna]|uniref:Reverse transcriptase domain-containing protein n=1 Tax=Pogonophryne albipinna TaxID=1090488 RepID=A0AAD6F7E9_9TELE|nr:hypothetical protein JOQ06_021598 [Pogonophryne albipinna]
MTSYFDVLTLNGRAIGADIVWGIRKLRVIVVYGPQAPAERTNLFTSVEPFLVTNRQGVLGLKPLCQGILEWWEARLRHVSEGKARAFLARSRSEFIEQSETCSAAFFSSVREKKARQVVTGFRDSQGIVVTEECQVVRVATDHFRDSFKEKDVGRGDDFLELLERQVPGDIVQALELPLTVSELEGALNRMNKGKVPGIDGLPVELYAKFWSILGPVLLEVLTEVLQAGEMSGSLATGVISLLYKKGDRTEIGNWRPLTMLCVDYKLLAKVLTDRLGEAMPHLVHVDQTCAVPGRSTRWNLQLLRDAIAWAEDRNLPLMLVALDQTKAFDRVQWRFMFSILERLGFGKVFIRWLRTLYMHVGSRVVVNGYLGDVFRLQSGVRQGCPLSPLLYVLYMEPLAAAIRADKGVRGFLVPGSGGLRVKLSQYADDTTLLLDRDECLMRSLQIMEEFGRASGSKLNCAKSSVKFFGKWRERMDVPGGLAFCPGPIKVLGVSKRAYGLEQLGAQGGTAAMALPPCSQSGLRAHPEAAGPEVAYQCGKILHRHGLARSPVCPRPDCKDEETIRHVMWDCPFAQGAWRRVEGWLGQSFPGFKITWDGIERGSGPCSIRGIIGKVRADMKGRMERDILKWGQHAAVERWKGGLGLVG